MSEFNISSSNASAVLTVKDLFPAGISLEMFATDQALDQPEITITETRLGVDGRMVAAYLPAVCKLTLALEAASPSYSGLCTLWSAMRTNHTVYDCTLVCTVPSIGRIFTWSRGVLKSGAPFPSLKKQLAPTTWGFEFETMHAAAF